MVEYHDSHSAAISDPDRSIIKNWKYPEASETICFLSWKTFFGLSPAGAYVLILGLLCGYPMGAKLAHDLYIDQQISRREGEYLLTFSCNASPAFIISYLSGILLKNKISAVQTDPHFSGGRSLLYAVFSFRCISRAYREFCLRKQDKKRDIPTGLHRSHPGCLDHGRI